MTYIRSFFLNFLIVFFVNRVIPGMEISSFEDTPNIGADFLFSFIVGFLNASIFHAFLVFNLKPSVKAIGIVSFIVTFSSFAIIAGISYGIRITTFGAYFFSSLIVWCVAFLSNVLEMKSSFKG